MENNHKGFSMVELLTEWTYESGSHIHILDSCGGQPVRVIQHSERDDQLQLQQEGTQAHRSEIITVLRCHNGRGHREMTKRRAFTAIELLVGLLVMAIVSATAVVSAKISAQTAKREAERVQAYIYRVIQSADRRGQGFTLDTAFPDYGNGRREHCIEIKWQGERDYDQSFKASNGCTYSDNFNGNELGELEYGTKRRQFNTGGTITIHGADGDTWYVIIASTEGRIRISDTPSD